ncbi:MAG: triose-phosphate isomerase [Burkholderiaceae bacterium]|uniref:Triosephosphate isomerase n=2 Tax=Cupriavidus metallidurans TaxID=119219 RepID=A0A482IMF8_9BURK|nr:MULTISPECIES: triose-phosphate isomerase [Cupriavidus]PCH55420.1 MAG: triose-phosphate isomerase [Burkholderiaceae bacterium]QBP09092.1 triose-phosphate isomerase [Cupriavidus metallidurans]QWC89522.1 triose-phosphate isomerase [Cupriavidus metallidurans]
MRQKLVIGNWKMHGSLAANAALLEGIKAAPARAKLAVCAPFPYLAQCQTLLSGSQVAWGAQDVSSEARGAFTGEVAASMLGEFGCGYALVGHSERRTYHGETDAVVAAKALRALEFDIVPVVCVGETLAEREAGQTDAVVGRQLQAVLDALSIEQLGRIVLAYEPVWAIGTGKTATSAQAQEVHAALRARVAAKDAGVAARMAILYGGSVKPDNAAELFSMSDIDGGLIGGASLKADDFLAIGNA